MRPHQQARRLLDEGWTVAFECLKFVPKFVDAPLGPKGELVTAMHCTCGDPKWLHDVADVLRAVAADDDPPGFPVGWGDPSART